MGRSWITMRSYLPSLLILLGPCLALHILTREEQFERFKQKYDKDYSSAAEERLRFKVFSENVAAAEAHNAARGSGSYTRGINQWSDLTQKEWEAAVLGGYKRMGPSKVTRSKTASYKTKDLPANVDWRDEGVISAVKNQGQCGSCWAFGTTEQIESYVAISSGNLVELSTQQVTSCAPNTLNCGGNGGCMGSTPPLGYSYIQLFGQVSEADYPYVSGTTTNDEDCQYDLASVSPVASITGYNNLPPNDQDAIMAHLANVGPLAISVAASNFKDYHGGVFSGCPYDQNIQLNHAVQLVGYGSDFSPAGVVDYWLVRNSWGESWGENGYIRILREATPQCGMDTETSGHVCQNGPGFSDPLHVCGMCGMLFETSFPLGAHLL